MESAWCTADVAAALVPSDTPLPPFPNSSGRDAKYLDATEEGRECRYQHTDQTVHVAATATQAWGHSHRVRDPDKREGTHSSNSEKNASLACGVNRAKTIFSKCSVQPKSWCVSKRCVRCMSSDPRSGHRYMWAAQLNSRLYNTIIATPLARSVRRHTPRQPRGAHHDPVIDKLAAVQYAQDQPSICGAPSYE